MSERCSSDAEEDESFQPQENVYVTEPVTEISSVSMEANDDIVKKNIESEPHLRENVKKFKNATLGRMGKMFKMKPSSSTSTSPRLDPDPQSAGSSHRDDESMRKEKSNSLGRMLKLVEQDGTPKRFFPHARAGSLSRILKRNPLPSENNVVSDKQEEHPRSFLSRMLGPFKGRGEHGAVEPHLQRKGHSLPPRPKMSSKTANSFSPPKSSSHTENSRSSSVDYCET